MILLEAFADYLASMGLGTVGQDIFLNSQPDSPDNIITIKGTGGYHSDNTGVIRNPTFQIVVRNTDEIEADKIAEQIYSLHLKANFKMGDFYIFLVDFLSEPVFLDYDSQNRPEIVLNLILERRAYL